MHRQLSFYVWLDKEHSHHPCPFPCTTLAVPVLLSPSVPYFVELKRGTPFKVISAHPDAPQGYTQQFVNVYLPGTGFSVFFCEVAISS